MKFGDWILESLQTFLAAEKSQKQYEYKMAFTSFVHSKYLMIASN